MKNELGDYPLVAALLQRRSRRFGKGMCLNGGPLAYRSSQPPQSLSVEEESALAFAACGITGHALAELPYQSGDQAEAGGGNIMIQFIGRTVASGCALHYVTVFVINDWGAWMLKRPQDFAPSEIAGLIRDAEAHKFVDLYERSRVQLADRRLDVPRIKPIVPPFNKWSANLPGTTYFLPVNEFTADYINVLLAAFDEQLGYFIVDERNGFRPAGIARFARSRGGHLDDDVRHGLVATVGFFETWLYEFAAIEQGGHFTESGLDDAGPRFGWIPTFRRAPVSLVPEPWIPHDRFSFLTRGGYGTNHDGSLAAPWPRRRRSHRSWLGARRSCTPEAILSSVLPHHGGSGPSFHRCQVFTNPRNLSSCRSGHGLAGWRHSAERNSDIFRSSHRRHDRLLRLRVLSLRAVPRSQRPVSHHPGLPGAPLGFGIL